MAVRDRVGSEQPTQISREALLAWIERGEYTVLDVRPAEEYAAGHLPGAIGIPIEELADRLAEIPADARIVAYCRGAYCVFAHDAVELLNRSGRNAVRLEDGLLEWRLADLPVETATLLAQTRTAYLRTPASRRTVLAGRFTGDRETISASSTVFCGQGVGESRWCRVLGGETVWGAMRVQARPG